MFDRVELGRIRRIVSDTNLDAELVCEHLQVVLEYIADQTARGNFITASQLFSKFGELVGWPGRTAFRSWLQSCIDMKFVKSIGKTRSRRLELTAEGRDWIASKIL